MKRLASILLVFAISVTLFAGVTISESIPGEYHFMIRNALEENLRGRYSGDVRVSGGMVSDDILDMVVELDAKVLETKVAPEFVSKEIEAMLYYEKTLYAEGERLDYIYGTSYSAVLDGRHPVGTPLALKDLDGSVRAVLVVKENHGEASLLQPLAVYSPKPGLKLEPVSPMRLRSALWSKLDGKRLIVDVSLSYSTVTYPFVPYVSLSASFGDKVAAGVGVGGEVSFSFSSIWANAPSFIASSSVVASVEGDAWMGSSGLEWGGRYAVSLETLFGGNLSARIGVGELGYNSLGVTIGGGMRIL